MLPHDDPRPQLPAADTTAVTFRYRVGGLGVVSDIELPEFEPETGMSPAIDVSIVDGVARGVARREGGNARSADGQRVHVVVEGVVAMLVAHGRTVTVWPAAGASPGDVSLQVANTAMALVWMQRGVLVLHGAVVDINRHGVVFVGHSGQGKSTLAAACARVGHTVCSDDLAAIGTGPDGAFVRTTARVVRAAQGVEPPAPAARTWQADGKTAWRLAHAPETETTPLALIAVIGEGDRIACERVARPAAVPLLMAHLFCGPALASGPLATHFARLAAIVATVPVCRLVRPLDLERLPEVVATIERRLLSR